MANVIGLKDYKKKGDGLGSLPAIDSIVSDCEKVHSVDPTVEENAGYYTREGMSKDISEKDDNDND